jgi:DeoR family fructose operon transcriptional repressor
MVAEERRRQIIDYLDKHGSAKVGYLAERFGISEMTVHRDLQKMSERGLVKKVHGGVVSKYVTEVPYRSRIVHNQAAKRAIARRGVELVLPGMTVFLSPGTTVTELARLLPKQNLRIITNSLPIAQELTLSSECDIVLTGGEVRRYAEALVGPAVQAVLENEFIDLHFAAMTGIDIDEGLTVYSESEAEVLRQVIKAARKSVLLTDSTKYDKVMGPVVLPLRAVHTVISEDAVPERYRTFFAEHDVFLDCVRNQQVEATSG